MFGNPVPGTIQAKQEPWKGTPVFRVTSTFADHVASGRGTGIDFGNGRCGDPVLACADGVVKQVFKDPGNGAIIVRIDHGNGYVTGYAHLQGIETTVGTRVARGIAIGHVGMTGATACHLHWGVNKNGVEIDGWPLLDQVNPPAPAPGTGGDMLQGTNPKQLNNKVVTITGDSTRLRAAPATGTTPVLAVYGAGTTFTPDWQVTGAAVGTATTWYGGWGKTDKGYEFGYLHASVVGPLTDFVTGGASAAELKIAADKGYNEGRGAVQGAAAAVPPR